MELYPIGTIVKIKEHNMIILGYKELVEEECFKLCYVIGIYPLGVRKKADIRLVEMNKVGEVVFWGYTENESYKQYVIEKKELYDSLEKTTPDEVKKVLSEMKKNLEKVMKGEDDE